MWNPCEPYVSVNSFVTNVFVIYSQIIYEKRTIRWTLRGRGFTLKKTSLTAVALIGRVQYMSVSLWM